MLRLLILALAAYGASRLLSNLFAGPSAGASGRPAPPAEMVRDEVCNLYLPKAKAIAARHGDRVVYFCSPQCQGQFHRKATS